jgi:uncharacterized phage protein gp47/JayE
MSTRYAEYTYAKLLENALARVDDSIDKREGSIIYDAIAPACYELAEAYFEMGLLLDATFADTSVGDDLTRRAAERGVARNPATYAIRKGEFDIAVPIGSRFSLQDTTYEVTELISGTDYKLTCEQLGVIGNEYSGTLIPISYISGLTTSNLTDILIPGEDEESDSALRTKYYANLDSQSFGGNQADYKEKTNALAGVGGTKVYPVWDGGGTVKLVIIDSTYAEPSTVLVDFVQDEIDPVASGGEGLGLAPIGHVVTVEACSEVITNVEFTLTLDTGYAWIDVEPFVVVNIDAYLLQLRQDWSTESYLIVRTAQIESTILQVTGVLDITGTKINTIASNLTLADTEIPVIGTVTNA